MSDTDEQSTSRHVPAPGEPTIPELEEDENIAPRPEEEIADLLRAEPDEGGQAGD
ncbi:MAG: hypothetical protein LBE60_11725 [Microbacterium sp.]|jgi:hypothetical protein|uniref:hypothetical protein n=1 Tax=Microbacterium sp. TaxID=51671 RepID=UPI0028194701|nr:hypothetical protein [Microbacterium sp.]MDR2322302.1 hypothetical protein [Microbacterium sp.]